VRAGWLVLGFFAALAFAPASSFAGVNIDLRFVPLYSVPNSGTGGLQFLGGGGGLEIMAGSHIGFRFGTNYLTRQLNGPTWGILDFPVDLTIYPVRWMQLGLGAFINYGPNTPAAFKNLDYGVEASLGFMIPIGAHFGIEFGAQYHYNFNNVSNTGGTLLPHEVLFWAGPKILIGGGESK
ncbi:MAG: hypothetical protein ACXVCH_17400, partial [Bdellovibrionota bacterium]